MILRQFLHFDPVAASYLFGCGGRASAAVVDPVFPIEPYLEAARTTGMRILYVIDTHVHADHVSAGRALAEAAGAEYVLFAGAGADFPFHAVQDGQVLELGNVTATVVHTPGHTPEHSGKPTSTIGFERRFNKAFRIEDEAAFVATMTADIPPPPPDAARTHALNAGAA